MAKSKFDFVSVVIVAACVLALIFLIYKTINMYNQNKATQADNKTEIITGENDDTDLYNKDGGTYQFDDEGEIVTDDDGEDSNTTNAGNNSSDNGKSDAGAKDKNYEDIEATKSSNASNTNTKPTTSYSSGRYMVVAGSFRQESYAQSHAAKLRRMGYDETTVSIFNKGAYASVLVDRFADRSDASALVRELEKKGIEALVMEKR